LFKTNFTSCFCAGGADRGGVAGLDAAAVDAAGRCEPPRRGDVLRRGDNDSDDSLLVRLRRRLFDGVDAPDACVMSSSESLSTNSRVLYRELRPVASVALHCLACAMSAAVAGVPSRRQECCITRWRRWLVRCLLTLRQNTHTYFCGNSDLSRLLLGGELLLS